MAQPSEGGSSAPGGGDDDRKTAAVEYGRASSIAWEFAGAILLCTLAGLWLDRRFGWTPWATVVGALLGFGAGFTALVVRLGLLGPAKGGAKDGGSKPGGPGDGGPGDGGTKGDGA